MLAVVVVLSAAGAGQVWEVGRAAGPPSDAIAPVPPAKHWRCSFVITSSYVTCLLLSLADPDKHVFTAAAIQGFLKQYCA